MEQIKGLAAGLQALGVGPSDRIATLLPACPESVYPIFLPSLLGSIHVPLNPLLSEPGLALMVEMRLYTVRLLDESLLKWAAHLPLVSSR